MNIGDKVRMICDRHVVEGVVLDVREGEELDLLATMNLSTALALAAEGNWQRGIAVRYLYTRDVDGSAAWANTVLIEDEHGVWWNLFGKRVELQPVAVQEELFRVAGAGGYPN